MITLLQPKYSKKITLLTMLAILAADLGTAIYCYLSGNLTLLSKLYIFLFAVLCFAVRPFFKDNFMQWLFSYLTVQNISYIVIILSFIGSRRLPYPAYANSLLRTILFGAFLLILSRHMRPLYRQAVEHWSAYFAVALGIYITFNYYVLSSDDIVVTLTKQAMPLLLVIFVGLAAYGSIFVSLNISALPAAALVGCCLNWKTPAQKMPLLMKTVILLHMKTVMVSAARVSLPLQRSMTASFCIKLKTVFFEYVFWCENT